LGMQLIETFTPLFLGSDYSIFQPASGEIIRLLWPDSQQPTRRESG
jgi:hypothetical protein